MSIKHFYVVIATIITLIGSATAIEVHELKTPKGLTVWFTQDKSVPLISVSFSFQNAGSMTEAKGKDGLANATAQLMMEGAGKLNANAFREKMALVGARFGFEASRDRFYGTFVTTLRMKSQAIQLFKDALYRPRFDKDRVDLYKIQTRPQIIETMKQPEYKLGKMVRSVLYQNHPYERDGDPTLESIDALTREDMKSFLKTKLGKSNIIIGVCGNLSAQDVRALVDELFGDLPKTVKVDTKTYDTPDVSDHVYVIKQDNFPQTQAMIIQKGLSHKDKDYWHLRLAISVLGQGFKSRLLQELREKKGLVYSIYASMSNSDHANFVNISLGTANGKVQDAITSTQASYDTFAANGITAQELQEAKESAIGSYVLGLSSTGAIASALRGLQEINYPITYINDRSRLINSITLDAINAFIKSFFTAKPQTTFLIGEPTLTMAYTDMTSGDPVDVNSTESNLPLSAVTDQPKTTEPTKITPPPTSSNS